MKVEDPNKQVTSNNDSTEKLVAEPAKTAETPLKPGEQLRRKKDLGNHFRTLHEKFNHVGKTGLQDLLERVYEGVDNALLNEIVSEVHCSCEKFDKAGRHPVAALPQEPGFNEEFCMDLLFIQNVIILHVMCMFTHLSSSAIVRSKVSKEVRKAFVNSRVNYCGVPRRIFSDTGGEFGSDHFRDLGGVFGIRLDVIGGGAHWALGLMERRNGILRTLVTKSAQTGKQIRDVLGPVDLAIN